MPAMLHPEFHAPPRDTKIWRYTDLAKFVWMLERRSLYLSRLKNLRAVDPYEGRFTAFQAKGLLELEQAPIQQQRLAIGTTENMSDDDVRAFIRTMRSFISGEQDMAGSTVCVNCWHMNEAESDAMWRLYSLQGHGIAIQSTYDRLERSFHMTPREVEIGTVSYRDYETHVVGLGNLFHVAMSKRTSFEHERELRVATLVPVNPTDNATGIELPVDIDILIENILVSPLSPFWHVELIKGLCKRYGVDNNVVLQSSLYAHPSWVVAHA